MMRRLSPFIVFVASLVVYFASTEHLIATVRFPTGERTVDLSVEALAA